jgi:hypothetical protein
MNEKQLQRQIVDYLRLHGYIVLEVGSYRQQARCPSCGAFFYARGSYGNSIGTPDLFIAPAKDPSAMWLGVELKRPFSTPKLRPEQAALAEKKRIRIVQSLKEVQEVVLEAFPAYNPFKGGRV